MDLLEDRDNRAREEDGDNREDGDNPHWMNGGSGG